MACGADRKGVRRLKFAIARFKNRDKLILSMNCSIFRNKRSFTLVELLTVITIIAILAGLGFAGAGAARTALRKTQTANLLNTIKIGVTGYQTEYGKLPTPNTAGSSDAQYKSDADEFKDLVSILMGTNGTGVYPNGTNPRMIPFCDFESKDFRNKDASTRVLVDAFKSNLFIAFDYSYDNKILKATFTAAPGSLSSTIAKDVTGSVALWSPAESKNPSTETQERKIVATWK